MKRMIMIAVLCTICFSVTSCSGNNSSSNDSTDNPTTQSATSASTEKVTEKSTEIVTEKTTEALTENQTEIETEPEMLDYTAVELAGKSLNEIIDIMGGDYEAKHLLGNTYCEDANNVEGCKKSRHTTASKINSGERIM